MRFQKKITVLLIVCIVLLAGAIFLTLFSLKKSPATTRFQQNSINDGLKTVQVLTGNVVEDSSSTSSNFEKQPSRTYPITDGETYRILAGRKYTCEDAFWADSRYVEILEVKLGKSWSEVFRTKDEGDGNCSQGLVIGDDSINISPLKDYIRFTLYGWEWSVPMMLNVKTKQNIFEPYTHSGPIIWSKSARNYAFISYSEQMGGTGKDGIWVSSFDNPDKPELIFNLQNWAGKDVIAWMEYALVNLKFVDNQTIEFSVVRSNGGEPTDEELAHYSYDLKRQKLTETFRK